MMTRFYQTSAVLQTVLLIISQLAVISLAASAIVLFKRKCKLSKLIGTGAVFALNTVLYIVMQLDSRLTVASQGLHLHIPYGLLLTIILLSLVYGGFAVLSETGNRKAISHSSIKEAFDNLPTAVCFFNESGLPVLCNLAMQRFSFAVCGKDVQFITDLDNFLADEFLPITGVRRDGKVFIWNDGSAWQLEKRTFTYESGESYTEYIAADVTDLQKSRVELTKENEQLRKVQAELKRLSANVVAVTREEEILNTKIRVHDEMGRCLMIAQKYLQDNSVESISDSVAIAWHRAVSMLKFNNETVDADMLSEIRKTCKSVKLGFNQTGKLPKNEGAAYVLTCAVRECVTNAVRYADATELYADFTESDTDAGVAVYNNGKAPDGEIVEGGGLSNLRRRVERAGGTMTVQSFPEFKLTVTVPKGKEGLL